MDGRPTLRLQASGSAVSLESCRVSCSVLAHDRPKRRDRVRPPQRERYRRPVEQHQSPDLHLQPSIACELAPTLCDLPGEATPVDTPDRIGRADKWPAYADHRVELENLLSARACSGRLNDQPDREHRPEEQNQQTLHSHPSFSNRTAHPRDPRAPAVWVKYGQGEPPDFASQARRIRLRLRDVRTDEEVEPCKG